MNHIIARHAELELLDNMLEANEAQLLAVWGRRRIGKTYLISNYFSDKGVYFELTGSEKLTMPEQILNFMIALREEFPGDARPSIPRTWMEAMHLLREAIEKISDSKKVILFFDELPWLAEPDTGFLAAFEFLWNRYMSLRNNVILVICGSAAAWMIKHVITDAGGMYGRVTKKIHLQPFNLAQTEEFLRARDIRLTKNEIVELYMAVGGVAKYLMYVTPGKSSAQIINDICFNSNGDLYNEFEPLYRSLFNNHHNHMKIIRALASSSMGLTKNELLVEAGLSSGGRSTQFIQELVESDFIAYSVPFGKKSSNGKYILVDEYSLFYLRWIEPVTKQGSFRLDSQYWLKQKTTPSWSAWSGYAFEAVCQKHILQIKKALGIGAVSATVSSWRYHAPHDVKGVQIDLVIDRADACINLCEIKFHQNEFIITKDYCKQLTYKKALFQEISKTRKTVFMTLITCYGVSKNDYYRQVIDGGEIRIEDLFV